MNWELYAWVKRGKRRKEVLRIIADSKTPLTVSEVKVKLEVPIPQASLTVKELLDKKTIECLNPRDKIGRLYKISKNGSDLLNEL